MAKVKHTFIIVDAGKGVPLVLGHYYTGSSDATAGDLLDYIRTHTFGSISLMPTSDIAEDVVSFEGARSIMQVKERRFEWAVDEVMRVCEFWSKDAPLSEILDSKGRTLYFIVLCTVSKPNLDTITEEALDRRTANIPSIRKALLSPEWRQQLCTDQNALRPAVMHFLEGTFHEATLQYGRPSFKPDGHERVACGLFDPLVQYSDMLLRIDEVKNGVGLGNCDAIDQAAKGYLIVTIRQLAPGLVKNFATSPLIPILPLHPIHDIHSATLLVEITVSSQLLGRTE
ncbi:hypothetical protein PC9H_004551 [Pleurotus ostreatus]|uniref:Uncharacterized protein n=1 Tax=Pleurotus ostreatus TaxID=5322 RepID=A0A8H7DTL0_PLEOS|nr:uncharacterized protein PC9H_004551 [Pleurotus ostreatus]KAF7432609.1 hypothetical protein PC9H_004551 [Pleurotus ostreatus]